VRTDWENYRQLKEGEIIMPGDHFFNEDRNQWEYTNRSRWGKAAPNPLFPAHTIFRRITTQAFQNTMEKFREVVGNEY